MILMAFRVELEQRRAAAPARRMTMRPPSATMLPLPLTRITPSLHQVCIYSTWKSGGYNTISGTSMASQHVAGAAALYKVNNPTATPTQIMTQLRSGAATRTGNDSSVSGYYGFTYDTNTPNGSRYYSYLEYAGGY
jgi:subtilisin family serine protease